MADNTNFFTDDQEVVEEPQTIKLGDKEYTQDDLSRLVGLGEIASEAEEKYKTKIDRVWPEFTKKSQQVSDYQRKIEELEAKVNQPIVQQTPTNQPTELTAEQKDIARKQLEDLGYGQSQFRQIVREELAAQDLLASVDSVLGEARENGNPTATPQDLLQYMADEGIKNPSKAYKLMFEDDLAKLQEKRLSEIRPSGMITSNGPKAGGKLPAEVKPTRANLQSLVQAALGGE